MRPGTSVHPQSKGFTLPVAHGAAVAALLIPTASGAAIQLKPRATSYGIIAAPARTAAGRVSEVPLPPKAEFGNNTPVEGTGVSTTTEAAGDARFAGVRARLAGFRRLQAGWDTYDAEPIHDDAIAAAERLLNALALPEYARRGAEVVPLHVVPSPDGGVQFEWVRSGSEAEIEFSPDGGIEILLIEGEGASRVFTEEHGVTVERALQVVSRVLDYH